MSKIYLVADTRETSVHSFIDENFKDYEYKIKQINVGDFLICVGEVVLACIERKSLVDFAASLKDGRYANRHKMIELRKQTGCQLYWFVEGPAFPGPNRKFARIPYANILGAMTKLMIRDNIHIVQTENAMHTAKRLYDFVRIFNCEKISIQNNNFSVGIDVKVAIENDYEGSGEFIKGVEILSNDNCATDVNCSTDVNCATDVNFSTNDQNTGLHLASTMKLNGGKSDFEKVVAMWAKIDDITINTGQVLAHTLSISDFFNGKISRDQILKLKSINGRILYKKSSNRLCKLVRLPLFSDKVRIISGVPKWSKETATQLVKQIDFKDLTDPECPLPTVRLKQKSGKEITVGPNRIQEIRDLLNYKK